MGRATTALIFLVGMLLDFDKIRTEMNMQQTNLLVLLCFVLALRWLDSQPLEGAARIQGPAVGITMDFITGWTKTSKKTVYLQYDGNLGSLEPHPRLKYIDLNAECTHYPVQNVGDPVFKVL